jgi:hypothetical protein
MKTHACSVRSYLPRFRRLLVSLNIGAALIAIGIIQAAPTDDPTCKIVLDAMAKLGQTPHHQYATMTGAIAGGKTMETEGITTRDAIYIKMNGKWTTSRITPEAMAKQEQENIRNAEVYRCQYERDENVDGEAVAVYKAHSENKNGPSDAEIWISKSRGLPLRETIDLSAGESQMSVRFDYANVQAPAVK